MTQPFFNVRTVVGPPAVSGKTLIKRLDAAVKQLDDTVRFAKTRAIQQRL